MASVTNAGRVGAVVLVGLILIGTIYAFFNGGDFFRHTYMLDAIFTNAEGIDVGYPVQLSGVQIGTVSRVGLTHDQKVDVEMEIDHRSHVPVGSSFALSAPVFGGEPYVEITPPTGPSTGFIREGTRGIEGAPASGDLTAVLDHADGLVAQLSETTRNVNSLLGDRQLHESLRETAVNAATASRNGAELSNHLNQAVIEDNLELKRTLAADNTTLEAMLIQDNSEIHKLLMATDGRATFALRNVDATTSEIRDITAKDRVQLDQMLSDMHDTTSSVAGVATETRDAFKNNNVAGNLSTVVSNLKATSDHLDSVAAHFDSLTGDPTVQDNLKQTIENLKDTTEQANLLLARINHLAGTRAAAPETPAGGPQSPGHASAAPSSGILPLADLLESTRSRSFHSDVDVYVPLGIVGSPKSLFRIGAYGLGESASLNLQYGAMLDEAAGVDVRAGLYRSLLGAGFDAGLGKRATVSLDAFDPNYFRLDGKGILMILPDLGLVAGAQNITKHPDPTFGLEYRLAR